jgi:hypothetical protein
MKPQVLTMRHRRAVARHDVRSHEAQLGKDAFGIDQGLWTTEATKPTLGFLRDMSSGMRKRERAIVPGVGVAGARRRESAPLQGAAGDDRVAPPPPFASDAASRGRMGSCYCAGRARRASYAFK